MTLLFCLAAFPLLTTLTVFLAPRLLFLRTILIRILSGLKTMVILLVMILTVVIMTLLFCLAAFPLLTTLFMVLNLRMTRLFWIRAFFLMILIFLREALTHLI